MTMKEDVDEIKCSGKRIDLKLFQMTMFVPPPFWDKNRGYAKKHYIETATKMFLIKKDRYSLDRFIYDVKCFIKYLFRIK